MRTPDDIRVGHTFTHPFRLIQRRMANTHKYLKGKKKQKTKTAATKHKHNTNMRHVGEYEYEIMYRKLTGCPVHREFIPMRNILWAT